MSGSRHPCSTRFGTVESPQRHWTKKRGQITTESYVYRDEIENISDQLLDMYRDEINRGYIDTLAFVNTCFWLHKDSLRKCLWQKSPKFELLFLDNYNMNEYIGCE